VPRDLPVALGERLPVDLRLRAADGGERALADFEGAPLVLVCVRYYG
jgi:hypothetical protein